MKRCRPRREGDEFYCPTCNRRWGTDETGPCNTPIVEIARLRHQKAKQWDRIALLTRIWRRFGGQLEVVR
jgi:hypothetical protein